MSKYKAVIGLEMHCELKSNSKVFSSAKNSYNQIPNENVRPVDMGFPGTLPVVNKKCVKDALKMSMVLNCKQPKYMYFDRKNYYYPDLPKGYQITQMESPVGINGHIDIECNGKMVPVYIHDIHLEEDAASLDHYFGTSCIDYNRAGVPLLELVTEPCLSSADEAVAFLETMRSIYQFCDVSEGDTKKGQIRCDVNVSIMEEDAKELGTKVEIKNVNSFGGVHDAILYEIERQSKLKSSGNYDEVVQETRRWDEESGTTIHMRSKVDAIDYKYFVDPNIPKYKISEEWLEEIRKEIPLLPLECKEKYVKEYGLSDYDASVIIKDKSYVDYYEECLELGINPKTASNWLTTQVLGEINHEEISLKEFYITPKLLKQIIDALLKKTISSKQAKEIFYKSCTEKKEPNSYINSGMAQISDEEELQKIVNEIMERSEAQISQYKNGKTNLFDYFVGQVMKETRGKANPVITKDLITKYLEK